MVHADATHFGANVTKHDAYEQVIEQLQGLMDGQRNWVCPCYVIVYTRITCFIRAEPFAVMVVDDEMIRSVT
ncbi:hypothetical protein TWF730_004176 [Orbilia blumenaviensis]|uniref:Uncharacterized protein n=1 Tax=Orbilia blumenaviensis TaxID=1796055 RepID=A0AAV9U2B1_9PEZI